MSAIERTKKWYIKKLIKIRFKLHWISFTTHKKIELYKIYNREHIYSSIWIKSTKKILKIFVDLFLIMDLSVFGGHKVKWMLMLKSKNNYTVYLLSFLLLSFLIYFGFTCVKISLHYFSICRKWGDGSDACCVGCFSIGWEFCFKVDKFYIYICTYIIVDWFLVLELLTWLSKCRFWSCVFIAIWLYTPENGNIRADCTFLVITFYIESQSLWCYCWYISYLLFNLKKRKFIELTESTPLKWKSNESRFSFVVIKANLEKVFVNPFFLTFKKNVRSKLNMALEFMTLGSKVACYTNSHLLAPYQLSNSTFLFLFMHLLA